MTFKRHEEPGRIVSVSPQVDPAILRRSLAAKDRALRVQPSGARLVEPSGSV